jgi:hypothetical protein
VLKLGLEMKFGGNIFFVPNDFAGLRLYHAMGEMNKE